VTVSAVSAEDELALGLVGTARRRELDAGRLVELARRSDPDRLMAVLGRQRIIHLGIARLRELGAGDLVSPIADRLEGRLRQVRWMGVEQELLTHSLVGTLAEQRVAAIPLKGAVLAQRLFGDPGLRESQDVDLLVSAGQLEEAVRVIRERFGYHPPRDALDSRGRPLLHYRLTHPDGLPMVELHWRVHWYEERSGAAMIDRCVLDEGLGRLAPADELACLLLVYARDGFTGIRPLADLSAWWDHAGQQLPANAVDVFAREFPELGPALTVSAALTGALAGLPLPEAAHATPRWTARMDRAARLANWQLAGANEQVYADIAMVDLLLTPRSDAWAYARRQVLLPLEVVADRLAEPRSTRPRLILAAAMHVPRILARFVLALVAIRGRRTRSPLPPAAFA
jgi:hypothetical protein